jgi:predicted nucleotidyltransferase
MPAHIPIDKDAIADFCHKWHVTELALFGSVLRDDFGPESDVDVLVTFAEGKTPGFSYITMEEELSELLAGRRVDVVTKKYLYHRLRDRVLAEAEVQFAA